MAAVSLPLRAARAAAFAAVCVALSAAGHALMSPVPLPPWAPPAAFVLVFAVAVTGAGRERSLAAISVLMVLGQTVLHVGFAWAGALGAPAQPGGSGPSILDHLLCGHRDSAGHVLVPAGWSATDVVRGAGLDPAAVSTTPGGGAGMAHPAESVLLNGGAGMLLAHLTVALLTAWCLRRGEAALFAVLRRVHATVGGSLRALLVLLTDMPLPPTAIRSRRHPRQHHTRTPAVVLRHAVVRRGPPGLATAC